jgi:hypothetical protein
MEGAGDEHDNWAGLLQMMFKMCSRMSVNANQEQQECKAAADAAKPADVMP